ncbi:MAG: biopolymer transporter ExbB [Rhodobacteraceae bacterium]|nr:biopolymer transporter ExbB [Paracoccaceae bacterium]
MKSGESGQQPLFALPLRQAVLMLVVVGIVVAGSYMAYGFVEPLFLANRYLNGVILGVFFIGILACFWQVVQIATAVVWIQQFLFDEHPQMVRKPPRLLAPLAGMLGSHNTLTQISTTSARSILDSVASRMDEARDIARYLSNLLIFLGLLGTFFGLAITVPAVVETIQALAPAESEGGVEVFRRLMSGLEEQLGGMGTAFSTSLLGLAGSLVVGLLDLFAGHGQNRFYRELEEWISGITKVGFGQSLIEAEGSEQPLSETALAALMEHLTVLHEMLSRAENERIQVMQNVAELVDSVSLLADRVDRQTRQTEERYKSGPPVSELLQQLSNSQTEIAELLAKVTVDFTDEESRMLLRNIDVQLLRISEDNLNARQDLVQQIRQEINALTTAVRSQSARRPARPPQRQEGVEAQGRRD